MAKKKTLVIPIAKCHVQGCQEDAAFGFREMILQNTVTSFEFEMGVRPNWCKHHDAQKRGSYEHLVGEFIAF
jgi:hypothetical protein